MNGKGSSQSVPTWYNESRFKDVTIVMEFAALHVGEEAGVISFLSTAFYRLLYKSFPAKTASMKSSLLKINSVWSCYGYISEK